MTDVRARTSPGARIGLRYLLCGLTLVLALLTSSCGNSTFTPGTPVVTLSAKPGRFTSYIVTLVQVYLTRQDGNIASLVSLAGSTGAGSRLDLARLDRTVDLVQASPVDVGTYVSATFQIDYTNAYIAMDNGGTITQVNPIDPSTGTNAGAISVTVTFDPNHPLVVSNPNSQPLALDIDLEASNLVSTDSGGNLQTTVKQFWQPTTTPAYDKPLFARGLFVIADTKNKNFDMNTRPLHDEINSPFGALSVNVTDQTYYQINGSTYVGASGLAALAALQNTYANLPVAAYTANTPTPFGNLNTITPSITATEVYVGSSLESTIESQVRGVVSSVSGDVVTMSNVSYIDQSGTVYLFLPTLQVTLGPNTIVSVDGVAGGSPSINSISPGQFIFVNGVANTDSSGNLISFDATGATTGGGAQVRLQNTTLWGSLNSATPGNLFLNVQYVQNNGEPSFLPTATNYQINTGSIDESATPAGSLLKVDGLANPLVNAPPYFAATAVTAASSVPSQLVLELPAGSTSALTSVTGSSISVNMADAGLQSGAAFLRSGPVTTTNLLTSPPAGNVLTITYNTSNALAPPLFGVGSVALGEFLFSDPNGFATKVNGLVPANAVYKLVATGQYDPTTGTFAATNITINAK